MKLQVFGNISFWLTFQT